MSREVQEILHRVVAVEEVVTRVAELRRLSGTYSDQPLVWLNLADDLARTGEFAGARSAAVRAVALDPDARTCLTPRLRALFEQGDGAAPSTVDPSAGRVAGYKIGSIASRSDSQALYDAVTSDGNRAVTLRRLLDLPSRIAREQLQRELAASQRIQDLAPGHTGAPRVIAVVSDDNGVPYQVLERIKGRPLLDVCGGRGIEVAIAIEVVTQLALMLDPLHRGSIFHGHLRPEDVIVDGLPGPPSVTLLGLGGAGAAAYDPTRVIPLTDGRLRWLTPELGTATPIDGRTDVYGLGLLLFYALSGRQPPDLGARLRSGLSLVTPLDADVLRGVEGPQHRDLLLRVAPVLQACVGPSIEDRPISAASLASALAGGRLRLGRTASQGMNVAPAPTALAAGGMPMLPFSPQSSSPPPMLFAPPSPTVRTQAIGSTDYHARAGATTEVHSRGALLGTEKIDRSKVLPPPRSSARAPYPQHHDDDLGDLPDDEPPMPGEDTEALAASLDGPIEPPQFTGSFPSERTGQVGMSLPWAMQPETGRTQGLRNGLLAAVGLCVLVGGGYLVLHSSKPAGPSLVELEHDADSSLASLDWDGALTKIEAGLLKEPTRRSLLEKRQKAEGEKKVAAAFERYQKAMKDSDNTAAVAAYQEIPDASAYHGKAAETFPLVKKVYLQETLAHARHSQMQMKCDETESFARKVLAFDPENVEAQDMAKACAARVALASAPARASSAASSANDGGDEDGKHSSSHHGGATPGSATGTSHHKGSKDEGDETDDGSATLPAQLTQSEVKTGVGAIQARVDGCFTRYKVPGTASVHFIIGNEGRVVSAVVQGEFTGTPTGICVTLAVRSAGFKKFSGAAMNVTYPFVLK